MTQYNCFLFTKEQAEILASQNPRWRVKRSLRAPNLYMVWSDEADHYIYFDCFTRDQIDIKAGRDWLDGYRQAKKRS